MEISGLVTPAHVTRLCGPFNSPFISGPKQLVKGTLFVSRLQSHHSPEPLWLSSLTSLASNNLGSDGSVYLASQNSPTVFLSFIVGQSPFQSQQLISLSQSESQSLLPSLIEAWQRLFRSTKTHLFGNPSFCSSIVSSSWDRPSRTSRVPLKTRTTSEHSPVDHDQVSKSDKACNSGTTGDRTLNEAFNTQAGCQTGDLPDTSKSSENHKSSLYKSSLHKTGYSAADSLGHDPSGHTNTISWQSRPDSQSQNRAKTDSLSQYWTKYTDWQLADHRGLASRQLSQWQWSPSWDASAETADNFNGKSSTKTPSEASKSNKARRSTTANRAKVDHWSHNLANYADWQLADSSDPAQMQLLHRQYPLPSWSAPVKTIDNFEASEPSRKTLSDPWQLGSDPWSKSYKENSTNKTKSNDSLDFESRQCSSIRETIKANRKAYDMSVNQNNNAVVITVSSSMSRADSGTDDPWQSGLDPWSQGLSCERTASGHYLRRTWP